VFERVALPSLLDVEISFLERAEVDTLLLALHRHRWGWAFGVILLTGVRRSEFCGLTWENVHLDDRFIDIRSRRTTAAGSVVEGPPKTRKARRRIPLDPLAIKLLKQRIEERDEQRIMWGPDWSPSGNSYVWAFEDGSPPNPDRLTAEFAKFCTSLDITDVGLHGLRHTFATVAIAAGMAPYALSRSLGHSTVSFTLDKYGHLWDDGLIAEFKKIEDLLGTALVHGNQAT
jgi:integrase